MEPQNGIMEDLGAAMGFEATNRLIAIFGGCSLYVPQCIDSDHPIVRVVGAKPAQRLAAEFGGETLNLPDNDEFSRLRRTRQVARLLRAGLNPRDVATLVGCSTRHVRRYRTEAEEIGLLPMILDSTAPDESEPDPAQP